MKLVKPCESSVDLKYVCPNSNCMDIHWITLREAQTKNFKIVCFCGTVFKPKRIENVTINYARTIKDKPKPEKTNNKTHRAQTNATKCIDNFFSSKYIDTGKYNFLLEAKEVLLNFGYSSKESEEMLSKQFYKTKETNPAKLVKMAINFIGDQNG